MSACLEIQHRIEGHEYIEGHNMSRIKGKVLTHQPYATSSQYIACPSVKYVFSVLVAAAVIVSTPRMKLWRTRMQSQKDKKGVILSSLWCSWRYYVQN